MLIAGMIDKMYFFYNFLTTFAMSTYASIESSCYAAEVSSKRILRDALLLASTWLASSGQHPTLHCRTADHFANQSFLSPQTTIALLNSKPIMALFALFDFPVGASCNHLNVSPNVSLTPVHCGVRVFINTREGGADCDEATDCIKG